MTVQEWSKRWLADTIVPRELTPKSESMYHDMLRLYILPVIGDIRLQDLTKGDCQRVLNLMGRRSQSYQHKCKIVIQGMIRAAYEDERLSRDVSAGIRLAPTAADPKARRVITDEERAAIEAVCYRDVLDDGKPNDTGAFYLLMLYCGLRPGECCALRKTDLDFEQRFVTIRQAKQRGSTDVKGPKTPAGYRRVPMVPDFAAWLRIWMISHATADDCEYVFAQRDRRTMITDSVMDRKWETYRKYVDIELGAKWEWQTKPGSRKKSKVITESVIAPDLTPYNLRHTYATNLISYGVDTMMLTYLMGHTDPAVTKKYYLHYTKRQLEDARQRMDEYQKHHKELQMSDIASWGMGPNSASKVELAFREYMAVYQKRDFGRFTETDKAALRNAANAFSVEHMKQSRLDHYHKARMSAKKILGDQFDKSTFNEVFKQVFVDRSWPAKPYKTDELIETYVTAMASTNYAEVRLKITDEKEWEEYIHSDIEYVGLLPKLYYNLDNVVTETEYDYE